MIVGLIPVLHTEESARVSILKRPLDNTTAGTVLLAKYHQM
jgi:hypothetical protein